ncbi:MAG: urease subunit beta [Verrucomicrobiota bacterium]|nr:urease subunit beta [Verrucomicrobiota bacterium]
MKPGEIIVSEVPEGLHCNSERPCVTMAVSNKGDRPIQVGSHFHFFEVNSQLEFDRTAARGFRLNIPAGTAIRFEPGDTREVELVALAGFRQVHGLNAKINGFLDSGKIEDNKPPARKK